MKRMTALLLAACLAAGLVGCGTSAGAPAPVADPAPSSSAPAAAPEPTAEPAPASPLEEKGKTLVVYYSATGSTEAVAEHLADALGADIFPLEPVEPYTSADLDWTDDNSRVTREHNDESLREVPLSETTPADWDSYDTILLGYPIWWGIAAWPVYGFVTANDFTGKTVIPFCTSLSSGLGESGERLADLAGTGAWLEGQRFASHPSETEVEEWAAGLGL